MQAQRGPVRSSSQSGGFQGQGNTGFANQQNMNVSQGNRQAGNKFEYFQDQKSGRWYYLDENGESQWYSEGANKGIPAPPEPKKAQPTRAVQKAAPPQPEYEPELFEEQAELPEEEEGTGSKEAKGTSQAESSTRQAVGPTQESAGTRKTSRVPACSADL
jgi:hypothetical protein